MASREERIAFLGKIYLHVIENDYVEEKDTRVFNDIITRAVGVFGLKEVKKRAWSKSGR